MKWIIYQAIGQHTATQDLWIRAVCLNQIPVLKLPYSGREASVRLFTS